jgi:hypothetical protein
VPSCVSNVTISSNLTAWDTAHLSEEVSKHGTRHQVESTRYGG